MTSSGSDPSAPRGRGAWASRRRSVVTAFAVIFAGSALASMPAAAAQEPPDSVAAADTVPRDTAAARPDSLQEVPDSLQEIPDSLRFDTLPTMSEGAPAGPGPGVWVFRREDILGSPAQTLLELLETVPGVLGLRGGDYGSPEAVTSFGLTAGRVRVYMDGFEMIPLAGGVFDISRTGLGGIETVRVERRPGEIRIELEGLRPEDHRPLSLIQAGTGDLNTNVFRGSFLHPKAPGGSFAAALDLLDTQGRRGSEEGARNGGWLRYTLHLSDDVGLRAEVRQIETETVVGEFPGSMARTDWTVRARARLAEGIVTEAYGGRSSIEGPEDGLTPIDRNRAQYGLRASLERGPVWAKGVYRLFGGGDEPASNLDLEAGGALDGVGSASVRWSRESWDGDAVTATSLAAWTEPLFGVSAFVNYDTGERGAPIFPPREPIPADTADGGQDDDGTAPEDGEEPQEPEKGPPTHRITDRTGLRLGLSSRLGPLWLSGAFLRIDTDSLLPLGTHVDRGGLVLPGGERTGWEAALRWDLPSGWGVYGSAHFWDQETRYMPELTYRGGIDFHDVFLESGNLELWGSLGVQGRDPMLIPLADAPDPDNPDAPVMPIRQPFYQTWDAFIQVRILTVRIYIDGQNVTLRENNQDFPGRLLPETRTTFGVRWTLWN